MQVILSSSILGESGLGLLRLIVVVFDFRYANDYTMASNMYLLKIGFIRG